MRTALLTHRPSRSLSDDSAAASRFAGCFCGQPAHESRRPACARVRAAALAAALDPAAPYARLAARYRRQHRHERDAEQLLGVEGAGAQVPVRAELSAHPHRRRASGCTHIFFYIILVKLFFIAVLSPNQFPILLEGLRRRKTIACALSCAAPQLGSRMTVDPEDVTDPSVPPNPPTTCPMPPAVRR